LLGNARTTKCWLVKVTHNVSLIKRMKTETRFTYQLMINSQLTNPLMKFFQASHPFEIFIFNLFKFRHLYLTQNSTVFSR